METLGISLEVPTEWSRELTSGGTRLLCREFPAKRVIALLSVHTNAAVTSLDRAVEYHKDETLPSMFPGCQVLSEERIQIGDRNAHFLHIDKLGAGQPASELFETVIETENFYGFISLYFAPGRSDDYRDLYERVRSSFKVDKSVSVYGDSARSQDSSSSSAATGAGSLGSIEWRTHFDSAFEEARTRDVPVLIAFNMDNESACLSILRTHYQDPEVVALSQKMVCLVGSTSLHDSGETPCRRFKSLRCVEHRDVEIRARETYIRRPVAVAPQHLICSPDGRLLSRREYMLPKRDLARMMDGAIQANSRKSLYFKDGQEPAFFSLYSQAKTPEERRQVIGDVLYSGDEKLCKEIFDRIASSRKVDGLVEVMETLSYCRHPAGVDHAVRYLNNPSEFVRAEAARSLKSLAVPQAVEGLKARLRKERIDRVKFHLLRALGTCGAEDEAIASLLVKQAKRGPSLLRINALLALRDFTLDKTLRRTLVQVYRSERNHEVKAAAALLVGLHQVEEAVEFMEKDLVGVGQTHLARITRWALSSIAGETDPLVDFEDLAHGMSREDQF